MLFIGVILNGMVLLSIPSYYQYVFQGGALLIAVAIDDIRRSRGGEGMSKHMSRWHLGCVPVSIAQWRQA